jgi:hypothetical protein
MRLDQEIPEMLHVITEQKKNPLMILEPFCSLGTEEVAGLSGDIFYVEQFCDGQVYCRSGANQLKLIELSTLESALPKSPEL